MCHIRNIMLDYTMAGLSHAAGDRELLLFFARNYEVYKTSHIGFFALRCFA